MKQNKTNKRVSPLLRYFTCAMCGKEFPTHTTKKELENEFVKEYGHTIAESNENVYSACTDCYDIIMRAKKR